MRRIGGVIEAVIGAAKWLVLPLCLLLCAQWPLRDLVQAYSRQANDIGQILFAAYVAVAVSATTRAGRHVAVDLLAGHYPPAVRRWLGRLCGVLILAPWALFIGWSGGSMVIASAGQFEHFADTGNAGYFVIKACLWVLTGGVVLQAFADLFHKNDPRDERDAP